MSLLNHYAYCSANPIRYTDPAGLDPEESNDQNWGYSIGDGSPSDQLGDLQAQLGCDLQSAINDANKEIQSIIDEARRGNLGKDQIDILIEEMTPYIETILNINHSVNPNDKSFVDEDGVLFLDQDIFDNLLNMNDPITGINTACHLATVITNLSYAYTHIAKETMSISQVAQITASMLVNGLVNEYGKVQYDNINYENGLSLLGINLGNNGGCYFFGGNYEPKIETFDPKDVIAYFFTCKVPGHWFSGVTPNVPNWPTNFYDVKAGRDVANSHYLNSDPAISAIIAIYNNDKK